MNITYTDEVISSYSNQINCEAGIYVDGEVAGTIEYVLYKKELTISYIFIKPKFRRKGYATKLIDYIKKENPLYKYKPSLMTDDGEKFYKGVVKESLFEKFEEDSDPIYDMGIGNPFLRLKYGDHVKIIKNLLPHHFIKDPNYPDRLDINVKLNGKGVIRHVNHSENHIILNAIFFPTGNIPKIDFNDKIFSDSNLKISLSDVEEYLEIIKSGVNEGFTEDSDPIHDMGIGNQFKAGNILKPKPNKYIGAINGWRNLILGDRANTRLSGYSDIYGYIFRNSYNDNKLKLNILFFCGYENMLKELPNLKHALLPELYKTHDITTGVYDIKTWKEYFTVINGE